MLITVAASVSTKFVEDRLSKPAPVVRAMPNTPCVLNAGMTALCGGRNATPDHLKTAEAIFKCVGKRYLWMNP